MKRKELKVKFYKRFEIFDTLMNILRHKKLSLTVVPLAMLPNTTVASTANSTVVFSSTIKSMSLKKKQIKISDFSLKVLLQCSYIVLRMRF